MRRPRGGRRRGLRGRVNARGGLHGVGGGLGRVGGRGVCGLSPRSLLGRRLTTFGPCVRACSGGRGLRLVVLLCGRVSVPGGRGLRLLLLSRGVVRGGLLSALAGHVEDHVEAVELLLDARLGAGLDAVGEHDRVAALLHLHVAVAAPRAAPARAGRRLRQHDVEAVAAAVGRVVLQRVVGRDRHARALSRLVAAADDDALSPATRGVVVPLPRRALRARAAGQKQGGERQCRDEHDEQYGSHVTVHL